MFNVGGFTVEDLERFVIGICRWSPRGETCLKIKNGCCRRDSRGSRFVFTPTRKERL